MIFEKQRWEVWNITQHPYRHSLAEFSYANPALPGVSNVESALNWILAVLYPNTQPNVATPAALPGAGNTIGDYRVVDDDGDGKSAGYRWEQREGDVAPQWYKVFDVDWSTDAILAAITDVVDYKYVWQYGKSDLDDTGAVIVGLYAGQTIYGGDQAGQNLTLNANSGDGVGADSGYVQVDSNFRPAVHNTYDLGTTTERFKDGWFEGTVTIGPASLVLTAGSITDTSGAISFGDENLSTTGNITGAVVTGSSLVADDTSDTVTIIPGSITDTTGAISFGAANISTTGTLGAGITTLTDNAQTLIFDPDAAGVGSITSSTGTIDFDDENLQTTGTFSAGAADFTQLDVDNIRLDANTISTLDLNGNLNIVPNGSGIVDVQKTIALLNTGITGTLTVSGQADIDNVRVDANTISVLDVNGDLHLQGNGTGDVVTDSVFRPNVDGTLDLGEAALRFNDLYLDGNISDGTDSIALSTLLAFRSGVWRDLAQSQPAQAGDSLFYDAVNSVWLASTPDSEILHSTISGLTTGDAGHTQFAMLAGRSGGQDLSGGTADAEDLILRANSHVPVANALSVVFDGVDEYATTGGTPTAGLGSGITNDISIFCWVKTTFSSGSFTIKSFVGQWDDPGNDCKWYLGMRETGALRFQASEDGGGGTGTNIGRAYQYNAVTINDGNWHYVGVTYTTPSEVCTFYIDGTAYAFDSSSAGSVASFYNATSDVEIARFRATTTQYFPGSIDEVTVFNTNLSGAQVTELYNGGATYDPTTHSLAANLVGWWRMGDGDTFSTLQDQVDTNDMTMTNMESGDITSDVGTSGGGGSSTGYILVSHITAPETDASYSGGWSGTDLGDGTHYWRDVYTKGEFFGLRLENVNTAGLPAASAQNIGRLVWNTDNDKAYVDTGTQLKVLGVAKYNADTVWNGTDLTKDVDVSASIEDARNAIWQLSDNANDFEVLGVKIEKISATTVRITTSVALPAGSYRLTGLE
jgi:hypothetical protein